MTVRKLRNLLGRGRAQQEIDAELADHLAREIEDGVGRGLSRAEATRRAEAALGRRSVIEAEIRDARTAPWVEDLAQDLRFGWRRLARQRGFTAMALLTMMLAIGATTAVFSVVDATLLRPLGFPSPERLLSTDDLGTRGPLDVMRREAKLAQYAGHTGIRAFNGQGRDWPERWKGAEVSPEFFDVLGVRPRLGRTWTPEETRVVILSHAFWRERFQARPDAVGQTLLLDERPHVITGVMPEGFAFPEGGASFWVPLRRDPRMVGEYWGSGGVAAIARLRPGATREQALAELRAWLPRIRAMFPWRMPDAWGATPALTPLADALSAGSRARHWLLLGIVALLLAAAVVNLANLNASQTTARQHELDVRLSLGATVGRLRRQLLAEALLIAGAGGALGLLLAPLLLSTLKTVLPADTPRLAEAVIDLRVLAMATALTAASGIVFGLLRPRRARWLVVAEAAVACTLLCGAGLLLRTWMQLESIDPGFQTSALITAELSPARERKPLAALVRLEEEVREKLGGYPGVRGVGAMNVLPLTREISAVTVALEDHPRPANQPQFTVWTTAMTPELPAALGLRLLRGRGFTRADQGSSAPVALISRAMAERFWPKQDPIGRRWRPVWQQEWRTIVGVVDDVRNYGMQGPPEWIDGTVYVPLPQAITLESLALAVRVEGDPANFERALPGLVAEVCRACAVSQIARAETLVAESTRPQRATAALAGGFALLALAMAAAGLFGVVNHAVIRRAREFGIRMALGARRRGIAWLVLGASLRDTLLGALLGVAAAAGLARWIRSLLYGVEPWDPLTFALAPVAMLMVAALACAVPVWRASATDAARSLRHE